MKPHFLPRLTAANPSVKGRAPSYCGLITTRPAASIKPYLPRSSHMRKRLRLPLCCASAKLKEESTTRSPHIPGNAFVNIMLTERRPARNFAPSRSKFVVSQHEYKSSSGIYITGKVERQK